MSAQAIVIFGASGDLALRMLFPSLYFLESDGLLPPDLRIVGAARSELSRDAFVERVAEAIELRTGMLDAGVWSRMRARIAYTGFDAGDSARYAALAPALAGARETVFYLSTSPSLYGAICRGLAAAALAPPGSRVVVEKPIGRDLASCRAINDELSLVFAERDIFRIDHYLGKEAVQNLLALRFANVLFEPLWSNITVEHVQITVSETVGVEGRAGYYDEYGAIRDMVQNHLLQLLCLVAMEPPANLEPDSVRNEKVKVLRSLRPVTPETAGRVSVRGQYGRGVAEGRAGPSYVEELQRPSATETFVALCAYIDNWRWAGTPFYLRTGKRMPTRSSQIVIQFRPVPHSIFAGQELVANRLVIGLQPDEAISLTLMNKTPSLDGVQLRPLALDLSLDTAFGAGESRRRIAYERLMLEAIRGDPTLFVRRDEAEAAWTWIDGVVDAWTRLGQAPTGYPSGSWGPAGAFALTERQGHSWYE